MTSVFGDRDPWVRMWHLRKGGPLRLSEAAEAGMDLGRARFTTVFSRVSVPPWMEIDERFWRVVGLYLAEGYVSRNRSGNDDADTGIVWSFHPSKEQHLVEEVVAYWDAHGIAVRERRARTSHQVIISSRFLATWWTEVLGLGRNAYEQRIPPLAWEQSARRKKALLSGLWAGDGNWTIVNKGRSPVLELGTVSDHLADGVARLLGDLGIIASWYRGRTKLSTKETHWLSISGAEQIRASLFLVTESARAEIVSAVTRQTKRMKPAGFRRFEDDGVAWVRVAKTERTRHEGPVYSLKVPGSQTVVVSGGVVASNCFPKDTEALRTLAGNTGYHFQLLNAVIQVNELQKRRVIGKLERHLGSLVGRKIALLGLAFKPDTDDMREASSLVLSARLQGEGATVRAYDPVAENAARDLLPNVDLAESVEDALDGADAVVLVTEWPEFAELDWRALRERMAHPLIVDGRNFLDAEALRAAGFTYEGIGRPNGDKGTS